MARFLKGIHGAYSGKVGNVIGSSWRSVDYVRSVSKKSSKQASEAQLAQRAKFGLVVGFLAPIKDVLNLGYSDKLQGKSTGYNKAVQQAINAAVIGSFPTFELDYSAIQIARGALSNMMGIGWANTGPAEAAVSWQGDTNAFNAFADDTLVVLIYNKDKQFFSIVDSASRADQSLALTFPASYSGDALVAWAFAGHRDGVKTSSSYYLGELIVN